MNTFNQANKLTKASNEEKYISSPGIPTTNVFELQSKSRNENQEHISLSTPTGFPQTSQTSVDGFINHLKPSNKDKVGEEKLNSF